MRVRVLFMLCVSAMAAIIAVAATVFVVQEWGNYRNANEAAYLSAATAGVLRTTEQIAVSRGPQNAALIADEPANPGALTAVANARKLLADELAAARSAVAVATYPERLRALAVLDKLGRDLTEIYGKLDVAYKLPRAQRDAALIKDYVPRMLQFNALLDGVVNGLERSAAAAHESVGSLIQIARLSWDMRDAAGRRASYFTRAAGNSKMLTTGDIQGVSESTGEIRHAWARLQATVSQLSEDPALSTAVKTAEIRFFGDTDKFIAELTAKGLAGTDYGVSFQDVLKRLVGPAQSALGIRDAAMAQAMSLADAARDSALTRLSLVAVGMVLVALLVIGVTMLFVRRMVQPLVGITAAITRLAEGDREIDVPARGRHDEIGEMAGALETLRLNAIEAARLESEHRAQQQAREARAARIEALTLEFDAASSEVIQSVGAAGDTMRRDAEASSRLATGTSERATNVAAGAEEASVGVSTIASAAEEMSVAVASIAERLEACAEIAASAVREVSDADKRIGGLDHAVERIGDIIKFIQDIASQTNLLALNATIEAARAGDAGRGFAVVAQEVKSLANQTARATDDIAAKIAAIQSATRSTVETNASIKATVAEVEDSASRIRGAMEVQAQTVTAITAAVDETALAADSMSTTIAAIREDTEAVAGEIDAFGAGFDSLSSRLAVLKASAGDFARKVAI